MSQNDSPNPESWFAVRSTARLKRRVTFVVVSVLVVIGLSLGIPMLVSPGKSIAITTPNRPSPSSAPPDEGSAPASVSIRGTVIVHIAGAVRKPGLIVVSVGARVVDAILRAGGLTPNADQCAVNLARVVTDGEQIIVPTTINGVSRCLMSDTQASNGSSQTSSSNKISLSRASLAELDSLPGVGPALAQRVIDWRTAHGGFQSVTQLDEVSGIGSKLMESLAPLVVP